ncbi:MAG: acetoacetate--CoA ligase [Acidimicrobiales bacterium]
MTGAAEGPVEEGALLFEPSRERMESSQLASFMGWLKVNKDKSFPGYEELWQWSVDDLAGFWSSFAEWADVPFRKLPVKILETGNGAEGARFFEGAQLNYVDLVLRQDRDAPAVVALDESGARQQLSYAELVELAGSIAAGLARAGVVVGDRVAAVLPNSSHAVAAFLATASLGAIWSSCAPEFGAPSMIDRFQQIEPKVLIAAPSYAYGGKQFDMTAKIDDLSKHLETTLVTSVTELAVEPAALAPVALDFDHPLWILYSSGTTGLPKAIVQGHGGILVEHLKSMRLQSNVAEGSRFFWFTTTGWMMWNFLVAGLLVGATIVCYDGSPAYPDTMALWRLASDEKVTYFGTSAPYLESCRKGGLAPSSEASLDLGALRSIGSTGAPLPPEGFAWASRAVGEDILVGSVSGGTDVCTAFLASCPLLPVHAGEIQCAALGTAVEAFGPDGTAVTDEVGELVVTTPMPSMPLRLWNDSGGRRLHDSYFAKYPGAWRHGDWIKRTPRHSFVVYGRSDATLNRGGVRMGTAELYRVVEAVDGVTDSVAIDTSELGRDGRLILLVVAEPGRSLDELERPIRRALREKLSPRHVPDLIVATPSLPRTLSNKKLEVPLRRILLGTPVGDALSRDSLADPSALDATLLSLREAGVL